MSGSPALGAKHPICVIQEAGQVQLEARCAVSRTRRRAREPPGQRSRRRPVTSTIGAKLQQDPSIDYVVTLGAPIAVAAIDAVGQANSTAKVVTFDLNADAAKLIKDGKILFSVDQQPYLQGYEAVDSLWLYLTNRNVLGRWAAGADRSGLRGHRQHRRHPAVCRGRHSLTFMPGESGPAMMAGPLPRGQAREKS